MVAAISLLALLILIAVFVYVRRKSDAPAERPPMDRPAATNATSKFHAVSIRLGPQSCKAAHEMSGKRFLSGAAPKIPLPNCNVLECKCRFVHHKDRRSEDDRRSPFGQGMASATGTHAKEQRQGQDRRHDERDKFL